MLLRRSQLKTHVPDPSNLDLRIVSTAGDGRPSLFIPSALKAFEDSDALTDEIIKVYEKTYHHLTNVTSRGLDKLWQILRLPIDSVRTGMESRHVFLRLAVTLRRNDILPKDYDKSFLMLYLRRLAQKAHDKDLFNIPIPGSYSLLGLTDDYQILDPKDPNEVFVRARGRTISGPVLIYRDPIIHIGDVQKANAVGEEQVRERIEARTNSWLEYPHLDRKLEALLAMNNVIFFSQMDNPPLPNKLSGGDLDGDRFEVLTKSCQFWGEAYQISQPDSYIDDTGGPMNQGHIRRHPAEAAANFGNDILPYKAEPFDIKQLAHFIGQYIRNDCFAELQDRLLALADQKQGGMRNPDVKDLAKWLSQAVDYAKNGRGVDLVEDVLQNPKFRVSGARPDFLRAVSRKLAASGVVDTTGDYQESRGLLGKLYRKFVDIKYVLPSLIDNGSLINRVAAEWSPIAEQLADVVNTEGLKRHVCQAAWQEICRWHHSRKYGSGMTAEADMFLHKQPDDFPFDFIQKLLTLVTGALRHYHVVEPAQGNPDKVRAASGCPGGDPSSLVATIYKVCLWWTWYVAFQHTVDRFSRVANSSVSQGLLHQEVQSP